MEEMFVLLCFFTAAHFNLSSRKHFSFSHRRYINKFSTNEIRPHYYIFFALALSRLSKSIYEITKIVRAF